MSQSERFADSEMRRVIQTSVVARRTEREVSQIHSKGIMIPAGSATQSHAVATATVRPATWRARWKSGNVAAAEKIVFSKTVAKKLEIVKAPKTRKISDRRKG